MVSFNSSSLCPIYERGGCKSVYTPEKTSTILPRWILGPHSLSESMGIHHQGTGMILTCIPYNGAPQIWYPVLHIPGQTELITTASHHCTQEAFGIFSIISCLRLWTGPRALRGCAGIPSINLRGLASISGYLHWPNLNPKWIGSWLESLAYSIDYCLNDILSLVQRLSCWQVQNYYSRFN